MCTSKEKEKTWRDAQQSNWTCSAKNFHNAQQVVLNNCTERMQSDELQAVSFLFVKCPSLLRFLTRLYYTSFDTRDGISSPAEVQETKFVVSSDNHVSFCWFAFQHAHYALKTIPITCYK